MSECFRVELERLVLAENSNYVFRGIRKNQLINEKKKAIS